MIFVTFASKFDFSIMQKYIAKTGLFVLALSLILNLSCEKEEVIEKRTFEDELAELDSMLADRIADGYDIDTTELGVFYIVRDTGHGPFPEKGDTCFIKYRGYFPNGTLFDASQEYHPEGVWKFLYREPDIITGFESGIGHMNEGSELEMIIPSSLGYGEKGSANVPPYTTLIYVAEMIKLRPAEE